MSRRLYRDILDRVNQLGIYTEAFLCLEDDIYKNSSRLHVW